MKAVIDKDLCTGCGLCCDTCPDVFEMQDTVAVVKGSEIPAASEETAKQAAADCPVEAIKIE
ncbi:MAG: ferredoxin [Elusimicrobia bacterium]|nr:ferredoxin [Elusimicrobiota bacterium]